MALIYSLSDPRTGVVRYVGVTKLTLPARLGDHIRKSRLGEKSHRAAWVRTLLAENLRPSIAVIEETEDRLRECFWIAKLRAEGLDLVNTTDGGDGCVGLPEESRRRIGNAVKRRIVTNEVRARISVGRRGIPQSEETKEKLRQINLGRKYGPLSASTREKMSASKRGHIVTEETRRKISEALTGRPTGRKRTHCRSGHAYTPENTFINIRGSQECRICRDVQFKASYERRKAKGLH